MITRQAVFEFTKEACRIFLELLISFIYACFAFFMMLALVLTLFNPAFLLFTLIAAPVSVAIGLPGFLLFAFPATLVAHYAGLRKRIYWIIMGLLISIPSAELFNILITTHTGYSSDGITMLLLAFPVGGLCGSLVHKRLYVSSDKV